MTTGSKVRVEKGCKSLGITKGSSAKVVSIVELGSEFSHSVKVVLRFLNSFASGKEFALYARHINRLGDVFVRLNDGHPDRHIEVVVVGGGT